MVWNEGKEHSDNCKGKWSVAMSQEKGLKKWKQDK